MDKECPDCHLTHTAATVRCPACQSIRDHHRERLTKMGHGLFSEQAFQSVYGPEQP